MRKAYLVITLLIGLVITLSVVKAVLSNMLSTSGVFVSKVEKEIGNYKKQNTVLSENYLAASSLVSIAQKAKETGFTSENTPMILKVSRPLAARR